MSETIELKGGFSTQDPRLDRIPQFDERSRQYPIRTMLTTTRPRSYKWRPGSVLDQGREGACVGFSWAGELSARPRMVNGVDDAMALRIYKRAQLIDEYPGENYAGTSVLAGAKVCQELGKITEYRWAFGIDDLIMAVGYKGPAVLGIDWYDSMYSTNAEGYITLTGRIVGGHAILARGVNVKEEYFILRNSWGPDWGNGGDGKITFADLDTLLKNNGEACIPVKRAL